MKEYPIAAETPTPELPVPDPQLFFLNHANRAFVEGQEPTPILEPGISNQTLRFIAALITFVLLIMAGVLSNPFWRNQVNAAMVLAVLVVGVIGLIAYLNHRMGDERESKAKGRVLQGEVTHSEKIRVLQGKTSHESLAIQYAFTAPGGVVVHGHAEGESELANIKAAPMAGTPVYVWFTEEGKHFLL
jgi:hypothetical protein